MPLKCAICEQLMDVYTNTVNRYCGMIRELSGFGGDAFTQVSEECEQLNRECRRMYDTIVAHVKKDHMKVGG